MIFYFVPYSLEKNIGKAYNQHMALLPKDTDWGVIIDGDIMLFDDFGHQIAEVINKIPDAGIITCLTNRISTGRIQLYGEKGAVKHGTDSTDIIFHRAVAKRLNKEFRGQYRKINTHISGFLMAIQKKTWKDIGGFSEVPGKMLGVDDAFSKRVLRSDKGIYIMKGLYVLHYYRMSEGMRYKDHLKSANEQANKLPKPLNRGRKLRLAQKNQRNARAIKNRRRR